MSVDDLLRLRDIGGISVSPDGRLVVFSVQQADPASNDYKVRWFVAPTNGKAPPKALPIDGGQPIPVMLFGRPQAYVPPAYAQWAPDGRRVAVRRLDGHRISLWIVSLDAGQPIEVATGEAQVRSFRWLDGGELLFRTGLNYSQFEQSVSGEAEHGWLWDERIAHYSSDLRPGEPDCDADRPDSSCENRSIVYEVGGKRREATTAESALLAFDPALPSPVRKIDGAKVRAVAVDPRFASALAPVRRLVSDAKPDRQCASPICVGAKIRNFGWTVDGRSVWFAKSEGSLGRVDGSPGNWSTLNLWDLKSGKVKTLLRLEGGLDDCHVGADSLVCLESSATVPPRIVSVPLDGTPRRLIADANPMFKGKSYPRVDTIVIEDKVNGPYFAQVVYPLNYQKGSRYPLVITQYASRGFLRGQVGNEMPIYPLSSREYFVLSVNWGRPPNDLATSTIEQVNRQYAINGRDVIAGVINQGIDRLISDGLVDKTRIAITGLSAGAEVTNYMLQRTNRFRAAIVSSGAQDLTFFALAPEGAVRTRLMTEFGTTTLIPKPGNSIYQMAWSNKPETLTTPLLINVGEYEAMLGFEGTQAIKHVGGPLEIRIFPDEQHVKYHPATYRGILENNIQWIDFWLSGIEDPRAEFKIQYERWHKIAASINAPKAKK